VSTWLLANEPQVRLGAFLAIFALLIVLQQARPRRDVPGGWRRRMINLSLVVIDTLILRVAFPVLAFELATRLEENGGGIMAALPQWAALPAGIILLDCAIYWQHRLLHKIPLLWRLHRVHHADTGFDVTTAVRFHPLEIALSMAIKLGLIALFGIPALAVLIFEILLSAGSLFTHANIRLPDRFERRLRWLLVTPEMHRIHHSVHKDETNSNFSFNLSLWDRLFGSYREDPRDGQTTMQIGLHEFRDQRDQTLWALMINPFRSM
jgi:sterol desaturase/sphingolipid hydroxylase (fatty acid hydroxylase superfamily)